MRKNSTRPWKNNLKIETFAVFRGFECNGGVVQFGNLRDDAKTKAATGGLIADDSPKCLTWAMPLAGEQVIRGEEACTVIKVEGQVD